MMNNFFGQQNQGFGYANQRVPKFTNPVTLNKDSLKLLQNKGSGFSLAIDEVDKVKAVCTHKEGNTISLKENGDGTVTCWLCHETFRIEDMDESYVEELVRRMNDVLQVVKTYYVDIPVQVAETYFQFIPYLKKLPQLYKIALDNFNQHDMGYKLQ
jgi:hypothetical protein